MKTICSLLPVATSEWYFVFTSQKCFKIDISLVKLQLVSYHSFLAKIYSNSGNKFFGKFCICVSVKKSCLSNSRVSKCQQFYQIVIVWNLGRIIFHILPLDSHCLDNCKCISELSLKVWIHYFHITLNFSPARVCSPCIQVTCVAALSKVKPCVVDTNLRPQKIKPSIHVRIHRMHNRQLHCSVSWMFFKINSFVKRMPPFDLNMALLNFRIWMNQVIEWKFEQKLRWIDKLTLYVLIWLLFVILIYSTRSFQEKPVALFIWKNIHKHCKSSSYIFN